MYIQNLISSSSTFYSGSGFGIKNSENEFVNIRYEDVLSSPVSLGYLIEHVFSKKDSDVFTDKNHHSSSCFSHEIKVCLEQINKEPFKYLLNILTSLRKYYEDFKVNLLPPPYPYEIIQLLMFLHDLRNKDVDHLIGSPGVTSDVINGKRSPSKKQAQNLGKYFGLPSGMFVPFTSENTLVEPKSIINMLGSLWKDE